MEAPPDRKVEKAQRAERLGTALLRASLPWVFLPALPVALVRTLVDPTWLSGTGAGVTGVGAAVLAWWRSRGPG